METVESHNAELIGKSEQLTPTVQVLNEYPVMSPEAQKELTKFVERLKVDEEYRTRFRNRVEVFLAIYDEEGNQPKISICEETADVFVNHIIGRK